MSKSFKLSGMPVKYKNFAGNETEYNNAGNRVFVIEIFDHELSFDLIDAGYNLRPEENEDGQVESHLLEIKVNYNSAWPPRIYTVSPTTGKRVLLSSETVECLDSLTIDYVDVEFNPHEWHVGGKSGFKPYCNLMYVLIVEHPFDVKWDKYESEFQENEE